VIAPPTTPFSITTTALPSATKAVAYSTQLVADGGIPGYTWGRSSGTIPSGITLTSAGVLSGTPTVAGSYTITFKCTDAAAELKTVTLILVIGA
jgi:hypothetical protein